MYHQRESNKHQSDYCKKHEPCKAQVFLGRLGDVGVHFAISNANCQLKGDPVLDDAHAKLCSLLDVVYVENDRTGHPLPDDDYRSNGDSQKCVYVKSEDGEIFVLLLLDQYHPDISQCKHNENQIRCNEQVVHHNEGDLLLL